MNFKSLGLILTLVAVVGSNAVFAQDAPVPVKEEKKESKAGSFSGVGFFEYSQQLQNADGSDKEGTFALKRAYLTYANDIGDKVSAKVTVDATDYSGTKPGVFLKNAYFQYRDTFAEVGVTTQAGVIGTPLIGITDKLGGMRWITQSQMDLQKVDNSADVGVSLAVDFMGFATLTGAFMNGEGYKQIQSENYKGKAVDALLSVTPVKGLYVNGYFRNEYELADNKGTSFGGGIAWSDKTYKVGANYVYVTDPTTKDDNSGDDNVEGGYIDAWVNVNLNEVVGMPITLNGRFMYVMPKDSAEDTTTDFLFGPGYQFNNSLQTAAIFGYSKAESDDDADMSLAVKFEFKY